jgi:hypothetical protein
MLEWLGSNMKLGQFGATRVPGEVRIWTAIVLGFFFLLRVSELLEVRFEDVQPRCGEEWCADWSRADSATILIRGSKTDQFNLGCLRTQHRVGGTLCPVGVMRMWASLSPTDETVLNLQGPQAKRDGRLAIQAWLKAAATATGLLPELAPTPSGLVEPRRSTMQGGNLGRSRGSAGGLATRSTGTSGIRIPCSKGHPEL